MKQTHSYTASHYVSDNGFPLSWMCRCCITGGVAKDREAEIEEHYLRSRTQAGKIIGRPAGLQTYPKRATMQYQRQSPDPDTTVQGPQKGEPQEAAAESTTSNT
ncbi:hypothetical protein Z517_04637 [Fonsecaea pedrosoi CBS 271.37]|uniref:Uncharacterized protein n=1 Tax=Fonsecaea pedrosoi CBS 271.37 TaxID=1442368 RepID=A0A0D2DUX1_9EURO|nr:uncharacterized protein Z517_04637 [Fonsecaea pedrosoi CBS 271.37]KIW81611.1 hypothetical protein Z517_04637 [Fonsecaea pedrosoi CBS 271.37]